jgi:hypothetical protein
VPRSKKGEAEGLTLSNLRLLGIEGNRLFQLPDHRDAFAVYVIFANQKLPSVDVDDQDGESFELDFRVAKNIGVLLMWKIKNKESL